MSELVIHDDSPRHIMVDIETMGTDPYCPVLSIGACRFAMDDSEPDDDSLFYQVISLGSCMDLGLKPNPNTISWWMKQSDEAKKIFTDPNAVPLPLALDAFTDWLNSRPDQLWGNSARFDCGILEACYKACGKVVPWDHWNERCYRTLKSSPKAKEIELVRMGIHHNALDDAISQAHHLRAIWKHLGL